MLIKPWKELPEYMQNKEVKKYYDILTHKKGQLLLKRLFDIIVSIILIVILLIPIILISIWIKTDSKGSVFYRQERVTQHGKVFKIFKFRTMVVNADQIGSSVTTSNDSRITKVGSKIRKVRLDELPQLFNVLVGDMSFVGTRPEVKKYVDQYTPEMYATLLLPAGVTSLASIEFKDEDEELTHIDNIDKVYVDEVLPDKMKYNLFSIKKFCFIDDILIMCKTVVSVIK